MILKSNKLVLIIKVSNLLIGFPNNKYPRNNKNYPRCLLLGGRLVLGGRDYCSPSKWWWFGMVFVSGFTILLHKCFAEIKKSPLNSCPESLEWCSPTASKTKPMTMWSPNIVPSQSAPIMNLANQQLQLWGFCKFTPKYRMHALPFLLHKTSW